MAFTVSQPARLLTKAVYGGCRFSVDAEMADRLFARFTLDVSIGDGWIDEQDSLQPRDWLAFAGVPPLGFPATTVEQQLAEKVHSYTMPRQKPNSRVKDLVDIVLLSRNFTINRKRMADSLKRTFRLRATHSIPAGPLVTTCSGLRRAPLITKALKRLS
ncbi:MAG: nucleotidyl transferase AbiEii/AbiGii toxin family protein [Chitinispirillaceae bacterium]|nr:nucleotidyl transferase AbiEii/AbiGii toxin family protein [Chitinispirillaceae bacterium]